MLPYMQRDPPHRFELRIFLTVSRYISYQLRAPPLAVVLWQNAMIRTRMPETAIHEYGYPGAGEGYIGSARQPWVVDSEPQSTTVKFTPDQHLRAGRGTWHTLHLRGDSRAQWLTLRLFIHAVETTTSDSSGRRLSGAAVPP